jgi:hypothetical protein
MVGRVVKPHYHRRRNLLSHFDYTPVLKIYMRIRARAIVVSATGPYHASVVRRNKWTTNEVSKHEYRRDGSGRR